MVSRMSAKPSTENKSLESAVKADVEDKAVKATEAKAADAETTDALPAQVANETVLPNAGVTEYPTPADDKVAFRFAHPVGKVRLDEKDLSGEEYVPGDEVELDADVAEALARAGAGHVIESA